RTQVDVYESPVVLVGDLRAEAINLVVAAGNADELCAEYLGPDNLGLLKVGWDENPAFESVARRLCGRGVSKITSRRARDGVESKGAGVSQCSCDHTVFEAQCGQADRVIFNE